MKIIRFNSVVVIIFVKVVHNSSQSTHSYQQSEKKNTSYFSHNSQLKSSEQNLEIDTNH